MATFKQAHKSSARSFTGFSTAPRPHYSQRETELTRVGSGVEVRATTFSEVGSRVLVVEGVHQSDPQTLTAEGVTASFGVTGKWVEANPTSHGGS